MDSWVSDELLDAVAHVRSDRGSAVLATKVLGQPGVQSRIGDVVREVAEHTARTRRAHALLPHLRKQELSEFLLIDDLPGHGIVASAADDRGE